jgi:membrane-associated phospholipid phosphatase
VLESGGSTRKGVLALVFVAAVAVFVALALLAHPGGPAGLDAQVHAWVSEHRSDALTTFFTRYTGLGQWFVLTAAAIAAIAALAASARRREALFLFVAMTVELLLNVVLKLAFARSRPPAGEALVHAGGYAFPSGHSMSSATFALALVVIAWPTRWRVPAALLAAAFALLLGASRIYLGVHWLTDVLAGWAMAVAVVSGTELGLEIYEDARRRALSGGGGVSGEAA